MPICFGETWMDTDARVRACVPSRPSCVACMCGTQSAMLKATIGSHRLLRSDGACIHGHSERPLAHRHDAASRRLHRHGINAGSEHSDSLFLSEDELSDENLQVRRMFSKYMVPGAAARKTAVPLLGAGRTGAVTGKQRIRGARGARWWPSRGAATEPEGEARDAGALRCSQRGRQASMATAARAPG